MKASLIPTTWLDVAKMVPRPFAPSSAEAFWDGFGYYFGRLVRHKGQAKMMSVSDNQLVVMMRYPLFAHMGTCGKAAFCKWELWKRAPQSWRCVCVCLIQALSYFPYRRDGWACLSLVHMEDLDLVYMNTIFWGSMCRCKFSVAIWEQAPQSWSVRRVLWSWILNDEQ